MPWIIGLIVAIGIALGVVVDQRQAPAEPATNQAFEAETQPDAPAVGLPLATEPPADQAVESSVHPVSIPALAAMQPDGRDLQLGQVLAQTSTYTRYFVTYSSGDLKISGIMNIPKGDGPWPVLILNHGYIDPKIYTNGRGLKREQDYFARQGFAVLHPDYRCHAQSDCDASSEFTLRLGYVKDVINAVEAVRTSPDARLDKTRLGMLGHSMGGGIGLNIMVAKPDLVDAYVLYAPVSSDLRDNYDRWTVRRPAEAKKIAELYGAPNETPSFWDNLSPRTFFSQVTKPIMVHHGTADESVPIEWSDKTVELLKASGTDVTYHVYPGQPHEFGGGWTSLMKRSRDFFRQQLTT